MLEALGYITGTLIAVTAAYVLGTFKGSGQKRNYRGSWVVAEDFGIFGFGMHERYRSRAKAEIAARHARSEDTPDFGVTVMSYDDWLKATLNRVHDRQNWSLVYDMYVKLRNINDVINRQNEAAVAVEENGRADEILSGIAGLHARMNHTDEILSGALGMLDRFREHMTHLDAALTQHTEKVGHVTAEMKAIVDDEVTSASSIDPRTESLQLPGSTERPIIRAARGVVGPPGSMA